jgi:hypothetical protein
MSGAIQTFSQIISLEALRHYLSTPLEDNEWGILSLDLDQTLIQARPTLGDEHFYQFLKEQNRAQGIAADAHYHWTVKIRAKVKYETCESVDKINQIFKDFCAQGWSVNVLTSRGMDMKEATEQHLADSKLDLTIDDVIFKDFDGSGKLLPKDQSLMNWMETQPQRKTCRKIRILFPDDSDKYCREVARVADQVENTIVTCLHYTGSLPNPNLSEDKMKETVVQLHAHKLDQSIPYQSISCAFNDSDLKIAMDTLEIQEIQPNSLHALIMKIAECDRLPFKR